MPASPDQRDIRQELRPACRGHSGTRADLGLRPRLSCACSAACACAALALSGRCRLQHGHAGGARRPRPRPGRPRRTGTPASPAAAVRHRLDHLPPGRGPHRRRAGQPGRGAAVHRLAAPPRRGGLRPAPGGRRPGHRGDRGRHGVRAGPGHRPGPLARHARHPGAAVRAALRGHRPARHHRDAGLRPGDRPGLRGRGDHRVPPRPGRHRGAQREAGLLAERAHPGRAPALRPAARGADAGPGPRLRGVRRAGRRLRPLPGVGQRRPGLGARAHGLLQGADGQGRRHVGGRRPGRSARTAPSTSASATGRPPRRPGTAATRSPR